MEITHVTGRQALLDLEDEMVVDAFAGGGGASTGIERALGYSPHACINHSPVAVAMHEMNHPLSKHYRADIFEVDPREVVRCPATGAVRRVGLFWASPDCTFHSDARGGKPIRTPERRIRSLAWVVVRWAAQVRPRVIILENVKEFARWGPLVGPKDKLRPCKRRKGKTFRQFKAQLRKLGYAVEYRTLVARDYGAPTTRERLFLVARCDGKPIVWPEKTHGAGPGLRPFVTMDSLINWSEPMLSIFASKEEARLFARVFGKGVPRRPLADPSLRRVARGVVDYVLKGKPFIVANNTANVPVGADSQAPTATTGGRLMLVTGAVAHLSHGDGSGGSSRWGKGASGLDDQAPSITKSPGLALVGGAMIHVGYGECKGQQPHAFPLEQPPGTVVAESRHALVAGLMTQHNGGFFAGAGWPLGEPCTTITTSGSQQQLVAAHLVKQYGTSVGSPADGPLHTITTGGHHALCAAFLTQYHGEGANYCVRDSCRTIDTNDRYGLVVTTLRSQTFVLADIFLRMLTPEELFLAQGFPKGYIIDRAPDGRRFTKDQQLEMVGNSVCPQVAEALVRANVPEMIARREPRLPARYARSLRSTPELA